MLTQVRESLYAKKESSKLNIVLNALIVVVILALLFELTFSATYQGIYVIGPSMRPTLNGATESLVGEFYNDGDVTKGDYVADTSGDYVYVNIHAKPGYGDIVVVYKDKYTTIIKRVIAKGGDSVKIEEGKLYIKYAGSNEFKLIKEDYVASTNNDPFKDINNFPGGYGHVKEEGHLVEDGCLFLLGDNRGNSRDSREDGDYSEDKVFGVVAQWSLDGKSFFTALHKFFAFDLPAFFGVDKKIKNTKIIN